MSHALIHADGPTPANTTDARTLGWEERLLVQRCDEEPGRFRQYVHAASVPELVSLLRALGRDCTYEAFGERQALLMVGP